MRRSSTGGSWGRPRGGLTFTVRLSRPPTGWPYHLLAFEVGAPTGEGRGQYVPVQQVLHDADYRLEIASFQEQWQRARRLL